MTPIPFLLAGLAALFLMGGGKAEAKGPNGSPPSPKPPGPGATPGPGGLKPGGGTIPKTPTPFPEIVPEIIPKTPYGVCWDEGIDPAIKNQIQTMLASVDSVPLLDQAAAAAAAAGYPLAAACLKKKADELRGKAPGPGPGPVVPTGGNMPYALGTGDYPYGLARYYTAQGGRWPELSPLNPQLGAFSGGKYPNWDLLASQGGIITLPASWDPWQKDVPIKPTMSTSYRPSGVKPGPAGAVL